MYAIVDIETTGGSAERNRITEVAIYQHDGEKITNHYQSLVNPGVHIPPHITTLTGITDDMVADAPTFREIAAEVERYTAGRVFIAHYVNFDYGFLRAEFQRIGGSFQRKKLCTVRLSRKILPGKTSYSLGKLCAQLNIRIKARHRAAGDAEATAYLFSLLMQNDQEDYIQKSLNPRSLEALLPPNLPKEEFMSLPEEMGIYYFLDQHKKVVYVGKANNIRKRVHSHFSGTTNTKGKYYFSKNIHHVDFRICGDELIALLTEAQEIKRHWPIHNRSMKRFTLNYGLYQYMDQKGYPRLAMGRCGKHDHPLLTFRTRVEIRQFLEQLVSEHELCPKLCGLQQPASGSCYDYYEDDCRGACIEKESIAAYQERFDAAITSIQQQDASFLICVDSAEANKKSVVLMEKGRYKGFGDVPNSVNLQRLEEVKRHLKPGYDDQDMQHLVASYLRKANPENLLYYS